MLKYKNTKSISSAVLFCLEVYSDVDDFVSLIFLLNKQFKFLTKRGEKYIIISNPSDRQPVVSLSASIG